MIALFLTVSTPIADMIVDFIEARLCDGSIVSLNWDESSITRMSSGFFAHYFGVRFGEDAVENLEQVQGLTVTEVGLSSESAKTGDITIERMVFDDGEEEYEVETSVYSAKECRLDN